MKVFEDPPPRPALKPVTKKKKPAKKDDKSKDAAVNVLPYHGYLSSGGHDSDTSCTDAPDDNDFITEWEEKAEIELGHGPKATWSNSQMYDLCQRRIIAISKPTHRKACVKNENRSYIPSMPCISSANHHRVKCDAGDSPGIQAMYNAMVSRPVGRKEMMEDPDVSPCGMNG